MKFLLSTGVSLGLGYRGFRCAIPPRYSALRIHLVRDRLQMVWLNATTHVAKVIKFEVTRNWSNQLLVRETMSIDGAVSSRRDPIATVSRFNSCSAPVPAALSNLNLLPETTNQRGIGRRASGQCIAMSAPSEDVGVTKSTRFGSFAAAVDSALGSPGASPTCIVRRAHRATTNRLRALQAGTVGLHRVVLLSGVMEPDVIRVAAPLIISEVAA